MARPSAGPPPVQTSAVVRRDPTTVTTAVESLVHAFDREDRKAELLAFLGSEENVQRFLAVAFHALSTNSGLITKVTTVSLIQAIKDSASLGLEPTGLTGEGYILPFGDQAVFLPGWRGYLKRIRNSAQVQDIDCQIVYMNDEFEVRLGTDPYLRHLPKLVGEKDKDGADLAERGEYRGAYAIAWMPSGRPMIEWMTMKDIIHDAKEFSPSVRAKKSSPWDTHPGEMARKTVIRRLAKRLPQSGVERLLEIDARYDRAETEENGNGKPIDVARARATVLAATAGKRDARRALGSVQDAREAEGITEPSSVEKEAEARGVATADMLEEAHNRAESTPEEPEELRDNLDNF